MQALSSIGLAALCLLVGCTDKTPKTGQTTNTVSSAPLNAPSGYLGGLANSQNKAISTTDTASLNQAIQMFNVDKGRFPKDLNELVESKYMPKLPDAPYGKKLNYDPSSGKVSVVDAE